MFGFGKKKEKKVIETVSDSVDADVSMEKMPSGMKETAERMMSG